MTDRTAWQKAFLGGDATHAVAVMHAAWKELVAASPGTFHPKRKEPELTEMLGIHLKAIRQQTKLTGLWSYESPQGKLKRNRDGVAVVERKRTDIQYFSNREDPVLTLIFEFKKLSHSNTQRNKYTGESGVLRFVTGEYSLGEPLALMVGILVEHRDDCVPLLAAWLDTADAKSVLHLETIGGRQTRSPSRFFAAASSIPSIFALDPRDLSTGRSSFPTCSSTFQGFLISKPRSNDARPCSPPSTRDCAPSDLKPYEEQQDVFTVPF